LAQGVEYDFDFNTKSPKRFYCTELVDNCFEYPIRKTLKKGEYILPDDFLTSKFYEVVWRKNKG
jgi:hypothetical protein